MSTIAAVLLAAGASSRMGRPKQLLPYAGKTLVEHVARQALAAGFEPVVAVVGAHAEAVRACVSELPIAVIENAEWESGMGSSISAGVRALPECTGVAILLIDQPLVTATHLRAMRHLVHDEIVAARYKEQLGVPAIFPARLFRELKALNGPRGARSLLQSPDERPLAFDLPEAATDIDTPQDWAVLKD